MTAARRFMIFFAARTLEIQQMEKNEDNMDQIKGSMETLSAMQMILKLIREGILTVKEGTKRLNMEEKELEAPGFAFYHKLPSIMP